MDECAGCGYINNHGPCVFGKSDYLTIASALSDMPSKDIQIFETKYKKICKATYEVWKKEI